jgi:hypothetical protein
MPIKMTFSSMFVPRHGTQNETAVSVPLCKPFTGVWKLAINKRMANNSTDQESQLKFQNPQSGNTSSTCLLRGAKKTPVCRLPGVQVAGPMVSGRLQLAAWMEMLLGKQPTSQHSQVCLIGIDG